MTRLLHLLSGALTACAVLGMAACSMLDEDAKECPAGLYVRFVYDYNTARADMFKDHVGHVCLYVYDEDGKLVTERQVSNTDADRPLAEYGYAMHFADGELPDGRYRLQAIAMQKDWDDALATSGAKYRHNEPSRSHELCVELDRADSRQPGTELYPVSNEAALDTLWHTLKVTSSAPTDGVAVPPLDRTTKPYSVYPLEDQYVTVQSQRATYATMSLIRNTKHLNITLRQLDDPLNVHADSYDVFITGANRSVAHDNSMASDEMLRYTPYHSWTTLFNGNDVEVEQPEARTTVTEGRQRTAHYNMMFNRLMHYTGDELEHNAMLMIVNKETGKTVAQMNLPSILAEGRMAYYTYNYSPQEYLDREYDYHLDFILKGDTWMYCDIVINTLAWSKRKQNVDL